MKTIWTRGLDEERTKDVKANFKESLVMRKRFKEILQKKDEDSRRARRNKEGYDCPNWAYKQADASGYERCLQEISELIED